MFKNSSSSSTPLNQLSNTYINYAANHEKEVLAEEISRKEQELKNVQAEISKEEPFVIDSETSFVEQVNEFHILFEEKKEAALRNLVHVTRLSNEIVALTQKQAAIHQIFPEEKLKVAMARRPNDAPLSKSEQVEFIKIEKALSNTSIIQALPSQVIEYQLGILWQKKETEHLSERLFEHLTEIRIDQAPDRYQYTETNGMLLESTPLQIAELANNYLLNDEAYKNSAEKFAKCLRGIQFELLEKGLLGIHNKAILLEVSEKQCVLEDREEEATLPEVPPHQFELPRRQKTLAGQKNKSDASDAEWPSLRFKRDLIDPEKGDSEGNHNKAREIMILERFIPEHKKNQLMVDEVRPINLWKLMQATLSEQTSKEASPNANLYFVATLDEISSKVKCGTHDEMKKEHSNVDLKYPVDSAMIELKKLLEKHEKEKTEVKECHLEGEKLIEAYFNHCDQYFQKELQKLEREKGNVPSLYKYGASRIENQKKREKARNEKSKEIEVKVKDLKDTSNFWKNNKELKRFITEHQHEEILVYQSGLYVPPIPKIEQPVAKDVKGCEQAIELLKASSNNSRFMYAADGIVAKSKASLFTSQKTNDTDEKASTKAHKMY